MLSGRREEAILTSRLPKFSLSSLTASVCSALKSKGTDSRDWTWLAPSLKWHFSLKLVGIHGHTSARATPLSCACWSSESVDRSRKRSQRWVQLISCPASSPHGYVMIFLSQILSFKCFQQTPNQLQLSLHCLWVWGYNEIVWVKHMGKKNNSLSQCKVNKEHGRFSVEAMVVEETSFHLNLPSMKDD